ncbi:DNA cross-link repair 1A protein [Arvicanthis niloticus]|uniref:DNA cross-link repair 1A protein n=1 Tax=Arvicanthis niloticus TaxID=61156 RepID=UPI001486C7CF|nr:DNA cross-link repair 1A protein [Arvicanthis niloticus]
MLEDAFWEEDIWEYKSKRKPKPVHPNNCSENISESVEKVTDGKYPSKRKRNQKKPSEKPGETKDHQVCLPETNSQISAGSSQNSSCGDEIQQSQSKETTPKKQCRTHRGKQVTPKVRPVYEGYCPSCQMPFSSLLGQTPRWHVFECLDSPPISDTECPEGLLCTSTIPSHYKKYTHVLLAQSRDSKEPLSSPSHALAGQFAAVAPDSPCNLEERQSLLLKTENSRKVLDDSLLMIQCLKTSLPPAETNRKNISSLCSQMSLVPQPAEFVKRDQLVGGGPPLAEAAFNSQSNSGSTGLPLPENDGGCEISYSPLHSDEETYDVDQELDDSQQELFFTQSSKDSSLEEEDSAIFENLHGPSSKEAEGMWPTAKSLAARARCSSLSEGSTLSDSFLISQTSSRLSREDPSHADAAFLLLSPALAVGGAASNYQTTKGKPAEPEKSHPLASSYQPQKMETPAVGNQTSLPLLTSAMSKPREKEGGERLPLHPTQSQTRGLQSKGLGAPGANCACRNAQKPSSMPLEKPLGTPPSSAKCSPSQPSKKVMKQMDIGVFFGLPPKRQEPSQRESASEGPNVSPAVSPNEKRPRLSKRKAQSSLSDLESDAKNPSESQLSVELSGERTQRRRKRPKKSNSPREGTYQRTSGHPINNPESGTVSLSKGKAFVRGTHGRTQRGNWNTSESSGAGKWRRTCPFYKRIPGTGFTVDAFQYGEVEGCTAYFLTHFHSDHYAGLSKDFTWPVYCSEITGNLLKKKLRVQEQYIHQLPMDTECIVDGVKVVLLDANHCPGATMILFQLPNGAVILHTGDFRADPSMERSLLAGRKVHTLFLDTTYCSPEYTFPSQQEVIQFAINTAFEAVTLNPRALVVCGTYSIGKEKVFLAIADVLGSKVGMSQEKYKTLQCLSIPEVSSLITTDMCSSLVHLLPMMQINFKGLQNHLKKCGGKYDQILAFRPTGWTHSNNITSIADITPQTKGNISIYGIPYSEHSSYLEMKRFVQWLKPQKIIPTVNVGSFQSRNAMERYFKEWRLEAGY